MLVTRTAPFLASCLVSANEIEGGWRRWLCLAANGHVLCAGVQTQVPKGHHTQRSRIAPSPHSLRARQTHGRSVSRSIAARCAIFCLTLSFSLVLGAQLSTQPTAVVEIDSLFEGQCPAVVLCRCCRWGVCRLVDSTRVFLALGIDFSSTISRARFEEINAGVVRHITPRTRSYMGCLIRGRPLQTNDSARGESARRRQSGQAVDR